MLKNVKRHHIQHRAYDVRTR